LVLLLFPFHFLRHAVTACRAIVTSMTSVCPAVSCDHIVQQRQS